MRIEARSEGSGQEKGKGQRKRKERRKKRAKSPEALLSAAFLCIRGGPWGDQGQEKMHPSSHSVSVEKKA